MFNSIPGLYPLNSRSTSHLPYYKWKCLQAVPSSPQEAKLHLIENHNPRKKRKDLSEEGIHQKLI
jgi:hypothetical protein